MYLMKWEIFEEILILISILELVLICYVFSTILYGVNGSHVEERKFWDVVVLQHITNVEIVNRMRKRKELLNKVLFRLHRENSKYEPLWNQQQRVKMKIKRNGEDAVHTDWKSLDN